MTDQETTLFKLLDEYVRNHHQCSLTEMFVGRDKSQYSLCFRPTDVAKDDPSRFACRYVTVDVQEALASTSALRLSPKMAAVLDKELSPLRAS